MSGEAESAYGPRRAAYDLKKLRGKGLLRTSISRDDSESSVACSAICAATSGGIRFFCPA